MIDGKLVLVTGTGTDVGKTYACSVFLHVLSRLHSRVCYYKPYQTGITEENGTFFLPDIDFMKLHSPVPARHIHTTYALEPALAPYHAALQMNATIDTDRVFKKLEELYESYDRIVLEGAGGVYVPIMKDYFFLDFFKETEGDIILVADIGLGTLNHTLLTYEALFAREMRVRLVVLNRTQKEKGEAEEHNLRYLTEQLRPTPVIMLPYIDKRMLRKETFPFESFKNIAYAFGGEKQK